MRTKKEYIVIFYDTKTNEEHGRTIDGALFTLRQAEKFAERYMKANNGEIYGVPTKSKE